MSSLHSPRSILAGPWPAFPLASDEISYAQWLANFRANWYQAEHVVLIGQTGTGKTFVASDILPIRTYTAVLAIKPHDETLERFTRREPKHVRRTKWPVEYNVNRALLHFKPQSLADPKQAAKVTEVLDGIFRSGGWCLYFDDLSYVINALAQRRRVVDLMNVGRSHGITIVSALQQPSSVSAGVPSEMKKQCRHFLMWRYTGEDEIDACARISGVPKKQIRDLMPRLHMHSNGHDRYSDFIYVCRGYEPQIVRVQ